MALKTFKPYTKSTRGTVIVDKSILWKGPSYKPLTKGQKSTGGRNNYGRITSRHAGGGAKHKFRIIDFFRQSENIHNLKRNMETLRKYCSGYFQEFDKQNILKYLKNDFNKSHIKK